MFDQDYAVLGVLLCALLLIALAVPAPEAAPRNEGRLYVIFLGAGATFAIVTGIMGLAQLPKHSAIGIGLAWLSVMPCVWMARAPRPADGFDDDGDDDDGGQPPPHVPEPPPAPDHQRPRLAPTRAPLAAFRAAPQRAAPAAALSAVPQLPAPAAALSSAPQLPAPALSATLVAADAAAPQPRRLKPRPRPVRADHRSILHIHAAEPHAGRRRRANLRRRVLRRCRTLFWVG